MDWVKKSRVSFGTFSVVKNGSVIFDVVSRALTVIAISCLLRLSSDSAVTTCLTPVQPSG